MPRTFDLRSLNHPGVQRLSDTSEEIKRSVHSNITLAVRLLAEGSTICYTIEPATLNWLLSRFLTENPEHKDPDNIQASDHGREWEVNYHDFSYGFVDGPQCPAQGRFAVVDTVQKDKQSGALSAWQFNSMPKIGDKVLVGGLVPFPRGSVHQGVFEYVPRLRNMFLMEGRIQFSTGELQTGRREYIPALKRVCLVEGTVKRPNGDVNTGRWAYNSNTGQMDFHEITPDV